MSKREMTKVQLFLNITGETEEFGSIKNSYKLEKHIPSEVLAGMSLLDILSYKASDYEDGENNGTEFDEFQDSYVAKTAKGSDGGQIDWSIAPSFDEVLYNHPRTVEERNAVGEWYVTMTVQTKEIVINHCETDYDGIYADAVFEPYSQIFGNILLNCMLHPDMFKRPNTISKLFDELNSPEERKKALDLIEARRPVFIYGSKK